MSEDDKPFDPTEEIKEMKGPWWELFDAAHKVTPEQMEMYKGFVDYEVAALIAVGCPLEIAREYQRRFSIEDRHGYVNFDGKSIADLYRAGYSPDETAKYPKRFFTVRVATRKKGGRLYDMNCGVAYLAKHGCSPEEANAYGDRVDLVTIALLHSVGFRAGDLSESQISLFDHLFTETGDLDNGPGYRGVGSSSVIFVDKGNAWKFSKFIKEEYRLLKKVQDAHGGSQKNLIKVKGEPVQGVVLEIEYINGHSLDELFEDEHSFSPEEILRCGSDVMNGICEMNLAGIYHRDIRPSNVMIENETGRAVILDLGIAADDAEAMPKDNRRYGGSDLMSLGQIMYKMATGCNLFNEHISDEVCSRSLDWADEIEQLRKQFCYDESMQQEYFIKINKTIKDSRLNAAIKTCLVAGIEVGEQQNLTPKEVREKAYAQVNEMFQRYAA